MQNLEHFAAVQIFQFYSLNKNENEYCDNCEEKGVERHDCKKQKEVPEDEETSEFLKEATNPHGTSSGLTSCQDFARDGWRGHEKTKFKCKYKYRQVQIQWKTMKKCKEKIDNFVFTHHV